MCDSQVFMQWLEATGDTGFYTGQKIALQLHRATAIATTPAKNIFAFINQFKIKSKTERVISSYLLAI